MNIVAHGLWGAALTPQKYFRQIKWAIFWSIFPDILWGSLTVPYWLIRGSFPTDWFDSPWWFYHLYGFGHSFIIWGGAFIISFLVLKRPYWPILFWLLHILVDIPGHTHFLTPFLYPLSKYAFPGLFTWSDYAISTVSLLVPVIIIFSKFSLKPRK